MLTTISSCKDQKEHHSSIMSGAFGKHETKAANGYDLDQIRESGEIIVATISGPESFYEHHGLRLGLQYALVERFAQEEGVSVRVELAKDTTELARKLSDEEVDVIAYPLSKDYVEDCGFAPAGYRAKKNAGSETVWAVRKEAAELAKALDAWYDEGLIASVRDEEASRLKHSNEVKRRPKAVFLSRERGVISIYDDLFKNASAVTGWDWKLIAAQCYQESAFDPNARSYVGAQGLMQLMPATAQSMGLKDGEVWQPEKNIDAAARYIVQLTKTFSDIRDPQERIMFVLASYNGGSMHVRDAMALARKYGKNSQRWDDVAPFILGLQHPQYYRDPVVKSGYMIGSETAGYVNNILERWRDYGGRVGVVHAPQMPQMPDAGNTNDDDGAQRSKQPARKKNRFSSDVKVMRPDDPNFNQME